MQSETMITLILILLSLLAIQVVVLLVLKRLINNLSKLSKELNLAKHRLAVNYTQKLISDKSFKTCQNCCFRQSFFKNESNQSELLFYRCKLNGTEIDLEDSCTKFQLESYTQNL